MRRLEDDRFLRGAALAKAGEGLLQRAMQLDQLITFVPQRLPLGGGRHGLRLSRLQPLFQLADAGLGCLAHFLVPAARRLGFGRKLASAVLQPGGLAVKVSPRGEVFAQPGQPPAQLSRRVPLPSQRSVQLPEPLTAGE